MHGGKNDNFCLTNCQHGVVLQFSAIEIPSLISFCRIPPTVHTAVRKTVMKNCRTSIEPEIMLLAYLYFVRRLFCYYLGIGQNMSCPHLLWVLFFRTINGANKLAGLPPSRSLIYDVWAHQCKIRITKTQEVFPTCNCLFM